VTDTAITDVFAWEAFDSRGRPTVAARVHLAGGAVGRAIAPSGASTGTHEATELRDGGDRYGGAGVLAAVGHARGELFDAVRGLDAADQQGVDAAMEVADGTADLGRLGANAVLAVSLAAMLAAADATRAPLYEVLADGAEPLIPMPMVNILSGGLHAAGALDIQDVLVVPVGAGSFAEAIEWATRVREHAARLVTARGGTAHLVADEGGLAAGLDTNRDAIALVTDAITAAGYRPGDQVGIAIDCAANQFAQAAGRYRLACENRVLDTDQWLAELDSWCRDFPILSIEDPLAEDDWAGWTAATALLGSDRQLLGDDLFVTNTARLAHGQNLGAGNAVLVKPNQAGTVSRAARVVRQAQAAGYGTVVSARSGDTEDTWLADLAVGWRAGQIKVGSTMRSERTAKWNRLLEIEAELGAAARFAGRQALAGTRAAGAAAPATTDS